MRSSVLVTGGTGEVGSRVVLRLLETGAEVRVLSRRAGAEVPDGAVLHVGDLATGEGLEAATEGVDAVVHCASGTARPTYANAKLTDVQGTQRLLAAVRGEPHVAYISIVGIDRIPLGYYRAKLEAEHVVAASGLPYSILRTTQFHPFVARIVAAATRPPVGVVAKGFAFQPVDAGEVAERLVSLLAEEPAGRAPDMGGPEKRALVDLALSFLRAKGEGKPVLSVWTPGKVSRAFREHHNCTDRTGGTITWERWLEGRG